MANLYTTTVSGRISRVRHPMIFLTGDTHGKFEKLSNTNWPISTYLTRNDYIIVAGDFGLLFYPTPTPEEIWWTKWLTGKPWTILFTDGNHENFDKLNALPTEQMFGGTVGKVAENIFHLRRGEIYEIEGKKILTFGGATSIDKVYRQEGVSWWPEEVPNYAEMSHCLDSMEKHNYRVDYVIAHTCPQALAPVIAGKLGCSLIDDPTQRMLDHITCACKFDHFFCGHFHTDVDYGQFHFLYNRIIKSSDFDNLYLEEELIDDEIKVDELD